MRFALFILLVLLCEPVDAQIVGRVVDSSSGRPLEAARVEATFSDGRVTVLTDVWGRFVIDRQGGPWHSDTVGSLLVQLVGYLPHVDSISNIPGISRIETIRMSPSAHYHGLFALACSADDDPTGLASHCGGVEALRNGDYVLAATRLAGAVEANGSFAVEALGDLLVAEFKGDLEWERTLSVVEEVIGLLLEPDGCPVATPEAQRLVCGSRTSTGPHGPRLVDLELKRDYVRVLAGLPPSGEI